MNRDYWDDEIRNLKDRIEALEGLLELYRDAVMIDATMEGPKFKGANSSALKRAWFHDLAALAGEKKDD